MNKTHVTIENNSEKLPNSCLSNNELTYLYANFNQIKELSKDFFECTALEELYLSGNKITTILNEIKNLTLLKELELDENQISELPSLKSLINLTRFTANLNILKKTISLPPNLVDLELRNNRLEEIIDLEHLKNLERLKISNNNLTSLPALVNTKLVDLRADENKIEIFPKLPDTLRMLDLSSNKIKLVENLNLKNLICLELFCNKITFISIKGCYALRTINLSKNELSTFPEGLFSLFNIKDIILNDNFISEIPPSLYYMTDLERLSLYNNPINDSDKDNLIKWAKSNNVSLSI